MSGYSSQIWSLISTLIGGGVAFASTFIMENRKLKKEIKLKNLSSVLIPYCESIEELLEKTKVFQINLETANYRTHYREDLTEFENLRKGMNEVKNYSRASKRLFFSKKTRRLLDDYRAEVELFEDLLRSDCARYQSEFHEYITPLLERYITVGVAQIVSYSLNKLAINSLELAFLSKSPIALSRYISSVSYDEDVPGDCGGNYVHFLFSGEEFDDCWYLIERDELDPKDIEDEEVRESCYLKFYIHTESNDENQLQKIILDTSYNQLLEKQVEILKKMELQIVKEIDKV